jgi:transglutaminase-like putative cysteine protease
VTTDTLRGPASTREILDRPDPRDSDPDVPSPWVVILAPAPVIVASLAGRQLIAGLNWWWTALVVTLVVTAVQLWFRKRSRGARFVALVIALIATSCTAAVANGIEPLGWLDRNGALGSTIAAIQLNPAPLLATPDVRLVGALAIVWIVGAALFVAAISGTPALAAVPALVILIVPGVVTGSSPSTLLIVATGVAFLALLWLSVRPMQRAFPAVVVGALSLAVAVALPTLVPLNSSFLSGVTGAVQSPIQAGRPGTLLRLGQDLRESSSLEVFRYRTSSGEPEYLKLADLDDFSSGDWTPTVQDASTAPTAVHGQAPVGVNPRLSTQSDAVIRITGLSSQYLPVPAGATSMTSQSTALDLDDWRWLPGSNTVRSTGPTTRSGDEYQVDGATTFAGPLLDAIEAGGRPGIDTDRFFVAPSAAQLKEDRVVPAKLPSIISRTAERVTAAASSNYEKARALQNYFLSGKFTYSTTAPVEQGYDGDNMQVIAKFLQVKAGYCVHFASAMAVMARVLGIPARIAVGYRPSDANSSGEYTVNNQQLHSWPELYFQGLGWVGFEPTPSSDLASQPTTTSTASAAPQATPTPLPQPHASSLSASVPTPTPSSVREAQGSGVGGGGGGTTGPWGLVVAVLAAALLIAMPGLLRARRRRRRLGRIARGRDPAVEAWREVVDDVVDHGFAIGGAPPDDASAVAQTARATFGRLRGSVPVELIPVLESTVEAVERERFADSSTWRSDGNRLTSLVLEARRMLDASVPAATRLRSRFAPTSLLPTLALVRRA